MPSDYNPPVGVPQTLAVGLRRVTAPNASPMTFRGTNTYMLGHDEITVIDPGPQDLAHMRTILDSLESGQRITRIVVTHAHLDHSALAKTLSQATGAPIFGFGNATSGRSEVMNTLAKTGYAGGGEGLDYDFAPDQELCDGETLHGSDHALKVWHTPGHLGNHVCLEWNDWCFTGDHIMGWATSLVSPPDGDLTDFMSSCYRLRERNWSRFFPGHGDVVLAPRDRLDDIITHRLSREAEILACLESGPLTTAEITQAVYSQTPVELHAAAQRNVLAHLIDLEHKSLVASLGGIGPVSRFVLSYKQADKFQ